MRFFSETMKTKARGNAGRLLRFETCEPRMLLSVSKLPGSDDSPVLVEQTTGFLQADNSALIDLAQTDLVETANVGAGEPSAQSTIFYASPNGNGNGTLGNPWSLDQANNSLQAGNTLYLTAGDYVGQIKLKQSGTAGNPIRITAAPELSPEDVHVRATGVKSDGTTRLEPVLINQDYLLVEGFTVSFLNGLQAGQSGANVLVFSDQVTIRNMRIVHDATEADGPLSQGQLGEHVRQARQSGKTFETGISVAGSFGLYENNLIQDMRQGLGLSTRGGRSHNVVRGNTIADSIGDGIRMGKSDGVPLHYLIENNVIFGSLMSHSIVMEGVDAPVTQVVIRNNALFGNAELGVAVKGAKNVVIEGNYFWGIVGDTDGSGVLNRAATALANDENTAAAVAAGNGSLPDDNIIIRNNVVTDTNGGFIAAKNFKVYNNTLLNNRRNFSGSNKPTNSLTDRKPRDSAILEKSGTGPNAAILNNLIGDHGYEIVIYSTGSAAIDGNAYYNTFQTPRFSVFTGNYDWTSETFATWKSWLQTKSNFTGDEAHSQVVSGGPSALFTNVPGQVTGDPAQYNFSLKTNSPAIDSGVFLTTTVGSGTGTTMTVADAKIFFDGYDITLGDEIQLDGQLARARITNNNGNTLTLNSSLSWSNGQGLSLSYEGSKPDTGAIEFTGSTVNFPPTAVDDSVTTKEGIATSTGNLVANDTDPNPGDTLFVQSHTLPSHGALFDIGNGSYAYLPLNGYTGSDSFTYVVSDGVETDTGTVNITITSPGDFDTDGDVDGADFLSWQRGFGTTYVADDLTDWQDSYGTGASVAAAVTSDPVVTVENEEVTEAVFAADLLTNDTGVVLGLDLQTSRATQTMLEAAIDRGLDEDYIASVQSQFYGLLAVTPKNRQPSDRVPEDSEEEIGSLDNVFEFLRDTVHWHLKIEDF